MFSAAEEVIFALQTQGMSQKGIAARIGCSQSTVSRILKKDFPAPVNNGGRPKKISPQDDRALKRIAHSNRFKSTTSITHLWNETMTSPVSRSTTYRQLRFHTEEKMSTVCTEVFQVDGGGLEASHLLWWIEIRHGLWQQGTLVFGGKSTKGTRRTRRLVWSALSSIRPPLWSGDACHPEELEVCASCLPRRQSTWRCTSIC